MSAEGAVRFVRLQPELFALLPMAASVRTNLEEGGQTALCEPPNLGYALLDAGRVMCVGGAVQIWPGRLQAWLLPGSWMTRWHWRLVLNRCRAEMLRLRHTTRIEATVLEGYPPGLRWATALGFRPEGTMRGYGPDGSSHVLLARVLA